MSKEALKQAIDFAEYCLEELDLSYMASNQAKRLIEKSKEALAKPAVPEIDYKVLIEAAYKANNRWAQPQNGCVAFKHGAEWFRDQVLAAAPQGSDK